MKSLFQRFLRNFYANVAEDISAITRYYDHLVHFSPTEYESGFLLKKIQCKNKHVAPNAESIPRESVRASERSLFLINGNFNVSLDIEMLLKSLHCAISRHSRVLVISYNPYLSWIFNLLSRMGWRDAAEVQTFVTKTNLHNLAKLSGFEVVRLEGMGFFPFKILGLGKWGERFLRNIPFLRDFAVLNLILLRPVISQKTETRPSLSIIIPARNEAGNIENALKRLPDLGTQVEVLFVEGNSNDGTWEKILEVMPRYQSENVRIRAFKQPGKGKNDAVRLAASQATKDLIVILDADLTMPPEHLDRFYNAYLHGHGDFVNGSRSVYPMEGEAMRFLNKLGNLFFAKSLSFVLGVRLTDSLCGTKLFTRKDYERFVQWRNHFGDFDPFGDFELLFPAAVLGLGIIEVPVRYRARTYGATNIHRFSDGWKLLKMTVNGYFQLRFNRGS